VPLAVDLLGDILLNSTFAEEELARERQVIIQEIGQAIDTPDDIIFDRFQETAFPGQALGRSILGHADVVRSISREAVASYMKRHYGGERMVLAAAGAVDHDRLVALAQAAFQDLPRGSAATAQPARYDGGDYREARGIEQTHLLIGLPGGSLLDDQFYAEQVLATLLGGGMSSRLFQEVRERRGLAYTVGTVPMSYSDGGVFGIYAACAPRDGRELGDVVCDEILRVAEDITAEEVTRAKTQLKAHLMMAMESTGMRAEAVANHLLLFDKPLSPEDIIAQVDAVSLDDVTAQATGLRRGRPTVTAIGPIQDLAPYDEIARRLPEAA
jgi:predicted Zn-dependent peptidase